MRRVSVALIALMALVACGNSSSPKSKDQSSASTTTTKSVESGTVEVLYMHGKQRCVTCVAIGTETQSVIAEMDSDKVVMKTIDFSTPEGEKIADKYEIASSSLIVVKDGTVDNLTAVGFQYARNNPELFRAKLRESIQKMLK